MGIRFRCHHCEHELNLKEFQAGRRARCPACSGRFRVPTATADFSLPLDDQEAQLAGTAVASESAAQGGAQFNLRPSSSDPDIAASRAASPRTISESTVSPAMPQAIREAPQAVWYVRPPTGGQYGPAEATLFHSWLQDSRVSPDSYVWRDGWPQWQLAGDVFVELFGDNWRVVQGGMTADSSVDTVSDAQVESPVASASVASEAEPFAESSPAVANVAALRRKKKQATYGIFIGVLALLAIVLLGVLISVVM